MIQEMMERRTRRPLWLAAGILCATILPSAPICGDTVYLRNGQKIQGQVSGSEGGELMIAEPRGTIGIPLALVDHVARSRSDVFESQGAIGHVGPWSQNAALEPTRLTLANGNEAAPPAPDSSRIEALDRRAVRHVSAEILEADVEAHAAAARYFVWHGEMRRGRAEYLRALLTDPASQRAALGLADVLIEESRFREAVKSLSAAVKRHPNSASVWLMLGSADYGDDHLARAIAAWKRSLALRSGTSLRLELARAEIEENIELGFHTLRSPHFILRYDNNSATALAERMLAQLEKGFAQLSTDLQFEPHDPVTVILYSQKEFGEVTNLPPWVRAANDGKIRIPIAATTHMTPALGGILKHELTHSFVEQLTLGRCPVWLDEGLAQLEQGANEADDEPALAQEFFYLPTYSALAQSFLGFAPGQIPLIYAKALVAVEYLRARRGMKGVAQLLRQFRADPNARFVLRRALKLDEAQFEQAVYRDLGNDSMPRGGEATRRR